MKTFNRKGDRGETSLLFGKRVSKSHPRCEAYGTLDEANAALGIAKNLPKKEPTKKTKEKIQEELFVIGSELATPKEEMERFKKTMKRVDEGMIKSLEEIIERIEEEINMPKKFIIPGGELSSSFLDLARSIMRRAERRVVALFEEGEVENPFILSYLNRASDLLYCLARYEEAG